MRRLIVNADDFGLTTGVNAAVVELNRAGALTSATLMATANSFNEAVSDAKTLPSLGVGCHVVLVDGTPALPADKIPSLIDPSAPNNGQFRPKLSGFVTDLLRGRISDSEIEVEATAQIQKLKAAGIAVTHVDTHKHTHMFPRVLRPVLRAARSAGIRNVRNPFEPAWSRNATTHAPLLRRAQVRLLHTMEKTFRRIVAEEGFATTDGSIGVLATGTLDASTLDSLLQAMPDGTWELVTHPGYNDQALAHAGTRLLASRETELAALRDISFPPDIELIHFGQLANSAPG